MPEKKTTPQGTSNSKSGAAESSPEVKVPARLENLETYYRFESDGSSRKEVHTIVKINSELGARQFARLNFDYNRAFETVEIPLVRVTHSSGGTADVLQSAITDNANPAVADAPAYQDIRVKSVRILGLEPSDTLEYRVITTVAHHPLAPEFWLSHSFDRSGVVGKEIFVIDLPFERHAKVRINSGTAANSSDLNGPLHAGRAIYSWVRDSHASNSPKENASADEPDIAVTTFPSWEVLSARLADSLEPPRAESGGWIVAAEVSKKADELTQDVADPTGKINAIYDFVSQKIATIDLPLGATEFRTRNEAEILSAGYGTAEDKFKLFAALARPFALPPHAALAGAAAPAEKQLPSPSIFTKLLAVVSLGGNAKCCESKVFWLDPGAEVAAFGLISSAYRGKPALALDNLPAADLAPRYWDSVPVDLPFPASQRVNVEAALSTDGGLTAKVKYTMRGDNELLLRIAFHQSPRDKWKNLAQLLSLSDGFRGQISAVTASDPLSTHDPFTVEYEIAQPKFVDWSKKPVRIPALLPLFALPDPPAVAGAPIELGTPLEVETHATLKLPAGFGAQAPTGTSVARDYATFASKYGNAGAADSPSTMVLAASRHINFLVRQLAGNRVSDYAVFLRAVQNDEAQSFTILPPPSAPTTNTAPKKP